MLTAEEFERIQRTVAGFQMTRGAAMSGQTYAQMQEIAAYLDRTMSGPYRAIEESQRSNRRMLQMATCPVGRLLDSEGRLAHFLNRVNQSFADFVRPSQTLMANAALVGGAISRLDEACRQSVAALALRPQLEFGAVCSRVLCEVGGDEEDSASQLRVVQTVQTAGTEVTAISQVVVEGLGSPFGDVGATARPPVTMGTYNLFERIDSTITEVLGLGTSRTELKRAVLPIEAVAAESRVTCHLTYRINTVSAGTPRAGVFQRTTGLSEVENSLMCLFADGQALFSEFITHMYKLVYEAAGAAKNRLADILGDGAAEFQVVQDIKHIRTYLQHHLGDSDRSQKERQKAHDAFGRLIGKSEPVTAEDYHEAQLALLQNTNNMLRKVVEKLSP